MQSAENVLFSTHHFSDRGDDDDDEAGFEGGPSPLHYTCDA